MLRKLKNERGFTLIELMVVILIIGILVAIAVPVFTAARENAYARTCQANLRTMDGAVQTFKANDASGLWPATLDALVSSNFIKSVPHCPKVGTGDDYVYDGDGAGGALVTSQSDSPHIRCYGFVNDNLNYSSPSHSY